MLQHYSDDLKPCQCLSSQDNLVAAAAADLVELPIGDCNDRVGQADIVDVTATTDITPVEGTTLAKLELLQRSGKLQD